MSACTGCGTTVDDLEVPGPFMCSSCPPTTCEDCGGINHPATERMCSCWVSLAEMPLADVKAIFAGDGTFNVDGDGRVTVAEPTEGGSES